MFTNICRLDRSRKLDRTELGAELKLNCHAVLCHLWFCCFLSLQSELVDLAESIQQKLSYFNELENINTVGFFLLSAS